MKARSMGAGGRALAGRGLSAFVLPLILILISKLPVISQITVAPPPARDLPDVDLPYSIWLDPVTEDFAEIQRQAEAYFKRHGRHVGYKHWKRWEFIRLFRLGPGGRLTNYTEQNQTAWRLYQKEHSGAPEREFGGLWQQEASDDVNSIHSNDGKGIGRVNVIAFHPTNTSIIFAGTPAGGLWKTTNEGNSWIPLTDGIPSLGVSGIAIHPTDPKIIYILTGDGDGGHTDCIGVLKTTNDGVTWDMPGPFPGSSTTKGYKLAMKPNDPEVLFAATTGGLFRTTDGGVTWTNQLAGSMRDIEFRPGTPDTMYASTTNRVYFSHDGGNTWLYSDPFYATNFPAQRCALAVTPADPNYVYALFGPGTDTALFRGLYLSTNSGADFSILTNSPNMLDRSIDGQTPFQGQAWWDLAIAVDPQNRDKVLIGAINIWKNNGWQDSLDWEIASYWIPDIAQDNLVSYVHADIHDLAFQTNSRVWAASDGGPYLSTNDGITWSDKSSAGADNGLIGTQFYKISGTPQNPSLVIGGTHDNGCMKWTGGNDMSKFAGGDGVAVALDQTNTDVLYFYQIDGSLQKSVDGGLNFTSIDPTPLPATSHSTIRIDPSHHEELWTGQDTLYRSLDGGDTWAPMVPAPPGQKFRYVYCAPSNDQVIYAATIRRIYRNSTNGSGSWTNITGNLPVESGSNNPGVYISGIVTDIGSSNQVWVTLSGYQDGDKVFFTSTGADPWTNVSGTLPNVPVNCIVYDDHETNDDAVYIGTDIGVFYKDAGLSDWVPFRNGLPNVIVNDLYVHATADKIYAGTFGRGLWSSPLYDECISAINLTTTNSGDTQPEGYKYFQAANIITSNALVTGGIGTQVFYKSGGYVLLNEGFRAYEVEAFRAWLGPCTGGIPVIPLQILHDAPASLYEGPAEVPESMDPANSGKAEADPPVDALADIHVLFDPEKSCLVFSAGQEESDLHISLRDEVYTLEVLQEGLHLPVGTSEIPVALGGLPPGAYVIVLSKGTSQRIIPFEIK